MIPLVDCHAHFYPPNYTLSEIEEHLASQIDGYYLAAVVVTPETLAESETVADLSNRFTQIKSCAGLHPVQHVTSSNDGAVVSVSAHPSHLGGVVEFVRTRALVAVGEIGLDFSPWILESTAKVWGVSVDEVKAEQRRVFSAQIELAKERGLPVNVHSRNAGHHAIAMLEECGMLD
ncbi:putative deoxyribonuclease tatdn3, partial [Rhizoclosmatium hyalinum]